MIKKEGTEKPLGGRWWEFYFVRYFIGTVIGAAIVFYLITTNDVCNVFPENGAWNILQNLNGYAIFGLAALGLTYCYIASAPILVFHAVRGIYIGRAGFSVGGFVDLIVLSLLASAFIYIELPNLVAALLLAFVLALQARLLARAFKSERSIVLGYYGNLTKARADSSLGSSEYVESYKHLREHANAFLIVLFEAALGLILYFSESLFTSIAVLVLWIVPAAIVWFFGNLLEHEYVNQKIHS